MLHAKFQDHRTSCSVEEDFDLDHLYKNLFQLPKETPHQILHLICLAVSVEMFEIGGHIHVYSPRTGADNHLGSNSFH